MRALGLLILAVGLLLGQQRSAIAHVQMSGDNGYIWHDVCGSSAGHDQPINIVFAGVSSADDLLTNFASYLPGWENQDGSPVDFSQDDGSCAPQDFQRATGVDVPFFERDHIRFKLGHAPDPVYGRYYLGAAHHDSWHWCPLLHIEGTSFNRVRDSIAAAFQTGGHRVDWIHAGNTEPASQPCTSDAGDGLVAIIWIAPMVPATPTVSIGSLTTTAGLHGEVTLQARDIGLPGLGVWTVDIGYDPSLASVGRCTASYGGVCNPSYGAGTIRVTGSDATGVLRGQITLATIDFTCRTVGQGFLAVGLTKFADANLGQPQPINAATQSGGVTCAGPTETITPNNSPTPAATATGTPTPTNTPTSTPTDTPTSTPTPTPRGLVGDVNCDRRVDSIDAALVLQLTAGLTGPLLCPQNADVNGDGFVDAVDAAIILQYVAGLLPSLPL